MAPAVSMAISTVVACVVFRLSKHFQLQRAREDYRRLVEEYIQRWGDDPEGKEFLGSYLDDAVSFGVKKMATAGAKAAGNSVVAGSLNPGTLPLVAGLAAIGAGIGFVRDALSGKSTAQINHEKAIRYSAQRCGAVDGQFTYRMIGFLLISCGLHGSDVISWYF